jgi:type IV secretory pathway TrbL component
MSHRNRMAISLVIVLVLALALAGTALADSTGNAGQPNQSCGSSNASQTPGNAVNAPGSAFNPNGVAGGVYAGQQPQNSQNPMSVSQYDVACFQVSQPH